MRFVIWIHYRALSKGLEESWGTLDLDRTMNVMCDMYMGKTDAVFRVLQDLFFIYQPFHQWVACPETGDMLVTFAGPDTIASVNPAHHFNLFDLLESESVQQ